MKTTLTLMLIVVILSLTLQLTEVSSMALLDYEELVRTIGRGIADVTGGKNIANELFSIQEATSFIANLPVK